MEPTGVKGTCTDADGSWSVTFTLEQTTSQPYYAPADQLGQKFLNGTGNTMEQPRSLTIPMTGSAEFSAEDDPGAARRPATLTWTPPGENRSTIKERVEAGHSSWIEVQEGRVKGTGTFTITDESGTTLVIAGTFDRSAPQELPARVSQRTSPLTESDVERLKARRPTP